MENTQVFISFCITAFFVVWSFVALLTDCVILYRLLRSISFIALFTKAFLINLPCFGLGFILSAGFMTGLVYPYAVQMTLGSTDPEIASFNVAVSGGLFLLWFVLIPFKIIFLKIALKTQFSWTRLGFIACIANAVSFSLTSALYFLLFPTGLG